MMTDDRPPADGRQRWKSYGYGPQVRRQFLLTYAVFGSFLLVLVLEAVSALEQHPWVGAVAAALAAWLSFYLGRAVYRHLWLMTHREVVPVTPPAPDPTKRAWVWSAVRQGRVLEPEEREVAAATARKVLWKPWQMVLNVVAPAYFAVRILVHLNNSRLTVTSVTWSLIGLALVCGSLLAWVMQARLRRWMAANSLLPGQAAPLQPPR
ncbi:hypothetical protein RKE38_06850 [Phycicoccus sp. M110.8]|uniref:hypothetical protein n=1 Tax=Phycicoccus sp. M110.8 TaxID=3075433 RepID=UPI0028FD9AB3|nr:hypothetical protein [Phycicoccus sp. M110.8]MDU0313399.1 hypothetical protein [Phycicoccus sp. M110.8]